MATEYLQYKVEVSWNEETQRAVARIPTLAISDEGPDGIVAIESLRSTLAFHLQRLLDEGKPLPESDEGSGAFLRVLRPALVPAGRAEPARRA